MIPQELATEIDELYKSLKEPLDRTPEGLLGELDFRCQWLARSSELMAEARYILDEARGRMAEKYLDSSATVLREMVGRDTAQENKLLVLADRLNATLVHQIDSVRTLISFEKEQRKNSR